MLDAQVNLHRAFGLAGAAGTGFRDNLGEMDDGGLATLLAFHRAIPSLLD
jgi:hypothetical protein